MKPINGIITEIQILPSKFGGNYYRINFTDDLTGEKYCMPVQAIFRNFKKYWQPIIKMGKLAEGIRCEGLRIKEPGILSADYVEKIRCAEKLKQDSLFTKDDCNT